MGRKEMKALSWIFVFLMILSLIIPGCSKKESATTGDSSKNNEENQASPEDVGYPDQLTYWVGLNGNVAETTASLKDVGVYKEVEKITGTKVDFKHPAGEGAQVTEQFNLMVTSGNLPDVIEYNWLTVPKGPDNAIESGTIIRLNELIEQYAPNLSTYLDENPEVKRMITTDEGNIYTFPFIRGDEYLLVFMGPIIRQDWLDKLNLQQPTTISEWEEVLTAFKENNPNGNGKNDEIPILLELSTIKGQAAFASAWGISPWFYNDNGKVKFGSIEPEFKEFLTTMNRWYENGLLDPDFAAMDDKLRDAKITGEQIGAFYSYTGSGIGKYTGLLETINPEATFAGMPHPTIDKGKKAVLGQLDLPFQGLGASITTSAKNPEEIVKWLDFAYSEEGHMLFNFGIEGVTYEMIDGYPTYTKEITDNPDGLPMTQAMGKYFRSSYNGPFIQDRAYMEQYAELPEQQDAITTWSESAENDIKMPLITMTADENQEYSSIMSDLTTFYDEMVIKFIMGEASFDKYDEFVATLQGMGIERAVELQQQALERYNER